MVTMSSSEHKPEASIFVLVTNASNSSLKCGSHHLSPAPQSLLVVVTSAVRFTSKKSKSKLHPSQITVLSSRLEVAGIFSTASWVSIAQTSGSPKQNGWFKLAAIFPREADFPITSLAMYAKSHVAPVYRTSRPHCQVLHSLYAYCFNSGNASGSDHRAYTFGASVESQYLYFFAPQALSLFKLTRSASNSATYASCNGHAVGSNTNGSSSTVNDHTVPSPKSVSIRQ